jgi:polyisoprenoid-binding protein YceI
MGARRGALVRRSTGRGRDPEPTARTGAARPRAGDRRAERAVPGKRSRATTPWIDDRQDRAERARTERCDRESVIGGRSAGPRPLHDAFLTRDAVGRLQPAMLVERRGERSQRGDRALPSTPPNDIAKPNMLDKILCLAAAGSLLVAGLSPAPAPKTGLEALEGQEFSVDSSHSSIVFRVMHLGTSPFWGRFNEVSGSMRIDPEELDESFVKIEIPVASIDTNNDKRDGHLQSAEFFSAREFPTLSFTSTKVRKKGDDTFLITGELMLRGKKKEITIPAKHFGTNEIGGQFGTRTGWEATFEIDRSEFGINYGVENGAVGKNVQITIALEGVAKDS